jgi:DNA-binding winged helix-turn-helix (wHTH) protein
VRRVVLVGVPEPPAGAWSAALRARGFGVASVASAEEAHDLPRVLALTVPGIALSGPTFSPPLDEDPERVAAIAVRRATPALLAVGPWLVNPVAQHMTGPDGRHEPLSALEVGLLVALAGAGGATVDREQLLHEVWGYRPGVVSRAVDHLVSRLRSRIEADPARPQWLLSERGSGYRLVSRAVTAEVPASAPEGILGREAEIRLVLEAWARGSRVVTVCGAPGIGKSTVARAAAARLGLVAAGDGPWPVGPVLVDDRLELGGPDQRLLRSARAPLGVRDEARIVVGPLGLESARALVIREAARLGIGVGPVEAVTLAAACDGNPLAIGLAVAALVDLIHRDPLEILRVPFRYPARHASLADALAWDPPPPATRAMVARIAAAERVDPMEPALADALARGLVVRVDGSLRAAPLFRRWCTG